MPYLEYPKIVYLGGDVAGEAKRVENAEQEAAAARAGFEALPANPPVEPSQPGGVAYLEFPKMLYVGGLIDGATRVVKNADEEATAAGDGFVALGTGLADESEPVSDEEKPKSKSTRRKA